MWECDSASAAASSSLFGDVGMRKRIAAASGSLLGVRKRYAAASSSLFGTVIIESAL